MCVQNFNDSLGFAIHLTYRILLRSSLMREPRHPLLKVVPLATFPHNLITFQLITEQEKLPPTLATFPNRLPLALTLVGENSAYPFLPYPG